MSEIDDLARQFQEARQGAHALADPLSLQQFNWRPRPEGWSVAECLVHLAVTARAVDAKMRTAIATGRSRGLTASGPFRYGWFSRWFEGQMEPPPRRRFKAPPVFAVAPGSEYDKDAVLREFEAAGAVWGDLLEAARGLDLRRVMMASPVSSLLRFPLGAYLRISAAHERRHLWQAQRVVEAEGFPRR